MEFFSDLIQYGYLSNALAACVLSGITCGVIGTYVVCRRMVFLAGGITHSSFGGLGIAFYLGTDPIAGAMIYHTHQTHKQIGNFIHWETRSSFLLVSPIIRLQVFLHKGFAALFTPPLRYKLFS